MFDDVMTAKQLVESELFEEKKSWLIEEVLPKGVGALVVGPEKSMKSSVTMDMAQAISLGEDWAGFKTTKARVLVVQNENSRLTEHDRLNSVKRESNDDLMFLHGGMFKIDQWAWRVKPDGQREEYNVGLEELGKFVRDNNIEFVVLDPLKDLLDGEETLNSNPVMNKVLAEITHIKNKLDVKYDMFVTFLIVAHARKQVGERSLEEKDFFVDPRHVLGATSIPAWYEVGLTMSPKINPRTRGEYSVIRHKARNFSFRKDIACGYVGDSFTYILPDSEKEKHRQEVEEEVKAEQKKQEVKAGALLDGLKKQGKVEILE